MNIWKLSVHKLVEITVPNIIPNVYELYIVKDEDVKKYENNVEKMKKIIVNYRKNLKKQQISSLSLIDKELIKPIFKLFHKLLIEPFADVNYGYALTVHKSQGSTYYNVYVDMDDIIKNINVDEGKKCLYTAITRASNEVHILCW